MRYRSELRRSIRDSLRDSIRARAEARRDASQALRESIRNVTRARTEALRDYRLRRPQLVLLSGKLLVCVLYHLVRAATLALLAAAGAPAVELHIQFGALERVHARRAGLLRGGPPVRPRQPPRRSAISPTWRSPGFKPIPAVSGVAPALPAARPSTCSASVSAWATPSTSLSTTRPGYKDGNLRLQDVKVVSEGKTGFYIRRVCSAMEASLARDFRYPLEKSAAAILEDTPAQSAYRRELKDFTVSEVRSLPSLWSWFWTFN